MISRALVFFSVLIISVWGNAQELSIKSKVEKVSIQKDSSFIKKVTINFHKNSEITVFPIIFDTELEEVSNVQVFIKKGKKFKPVKEIFSEEKEVELEYIASKKIKSIVIPQDFEVRLSYEVKCSELMYFASLPFFTYNDIDTLKYKVSVPKHFHFNHNTIYKDSLKHFTIDSVQTDLLSTWNIETVPFRVKADPLMLFGIYRNKKIPLMRTIVTPETYKNMESAYMNDWYLTKVKPQRGLSNEALKKIDDLTEGLTDPKKITNVLYDYVRNNFKYVAIEIGMGAFIPTHTTEVYDNKQGDCKDLSNFLVEALNYKGIKSDIALASTFSHISDCNFPSLSSANHAICVAYIDKKPIILDPTDPIHKTYTPVESLQNRSIFIVNENRGEFYKIKKFENLENLVDYTIDLSFDVTQMSLAGKFNVVYNGISGNHLKRRIKYAEKKNKIATCETHFESIFGNQSISNIKTDEKHKSFNVNGSISILGKVFNDGDNKLLFIDFIPRLFESTERETLLKGTHIGNNFSKKAKVLINMIEPIQSFDSIEYSFTKDGASLNINIESPSDNSIKLTYEFNFDYVNIDKNNQVLTNELLESFKQTINAPIVLSKKH